MTAANTLGDLGAVLRRHRDLGRRVCGQRVHRDGRSGSRHGGREVGGTQEQRRAGHHRLPLRVPARQRGLLVRAVPGARLIGPDARECRSPCPSTTPTGGCGYRISAQNAIGIAAPGISKYGAYKVPSAPTLLRVAAGHNPNTAEIDWQRPASTGGLAITSYKYDVQVDAGPWTAGGTLPVSPTEAQVPCVGATISCQYRIYATNSKGSSVASAAKATSFASPSAPTALAMVITTANAAAGTSDVSATWSVPNNVGGLPITGYEVQFCDTFCPDPSSEWNTAPIVDVGLSTSYTTTCPAGEPTCSSASAPAMPGGRATGPTRGS